MQIIKLQSQFIIKSIEILESNSELSIVYTDRQLFGEKTDLIKVGEFNLSQILKRNYIDACAIYRKDVWEKIGGYDEQMPIQGWEDWDFWLSAGEKGFKFYYIPEPLFHYRVLENSMIKQLINNSRLENLVEYVYKKHVNTLLNDYWRMDNELRSLSNELLILRNEREQPSFKTTLRCIYKLIINK